MKEERSDSKAMTIEEIVKSLADVLGQAELGIGKSSWLSPPLLALRGELEKIAGEIGCGLNGNQKAISIKVICVASSCWRFLKDLGLYSPQAATWSKCAFEIRESAEDFHQKFYSKK